MENRSPSGYHLIRKEKTFDVTALIAAVRFYTKPDFFEPCWEEYEFAQIFYVVSGSGILTTEHGSSPFHRGMMFYRPAFQRSIYQWDPGEVQFVLIDFICESEAMEDIPREPVLLNEEEQAALLDVMNTAIRSCESCPEDMPMMGMRLKANVPAVVMSFIYASLERFLALLYCRLAGISLGMDESQKVSSSIDGAQLVTKVKQYLTENLHRQLRLEDICQTFPVSPSALTRKFRKETGMGVMEYFTDQKIRIAKHRIAKASVSFAQIAESLGYSSANYFTKVFKAKTGMTPTEYSRFVSKRRAAVN